MRSNSSVDFIDTADSYGPRVSERLIAEALFPYPDGLVIATKGGLLRPEPGPGWPVDARPEHLREVLEGSLRDPQGSTRSISTSSTGPTRTCPTRSRSAPWPSFKRQGKIRHIGVSNVDATELARARAVTDDRLGAEPLQPLRPATPTTCSTCVSATASAFLPWAPVGQGDVGDDVVADIARRHGASSYQIVIAWLLARSPVMLPIPGTGSVAHLEENVAAASITLTPGEIDEIHGIKDGA